MKHTITIKTIEKLTHNVLRVETEKPANYNFKSGQATSVAINKEGWDNETRSFTFTSLPNQEHLEFVIKAYPTHKGVTNEVLKLEVGDQLLIEHPRGTINYKGEGVFIAGGAGVTPFISILRELESNNKIGNNKLIFANKTTEDIINKEEFKQMLGENFINILSEEKSKEHFHGIIDKKFLEASGIKKHEYIYLCGPKPMMSSIEEHLNKLGINKDRIIKEEF